ncbi:MAG: hypothetical protein H6552_09740 [Chitinophagales bacterium]|nr:hypothetical protein [Chitinophagales bacterium]
MEIENILIRPENKKQFMLIKSLLEEMRIKYITKKNNINYSILEMKIKAARKEKKEQKLTIVDPNNIWESI